MIATSANAALQAQVEPNASYWRSLRYFSIYRLIIALLFLVAATLFGNTLHLGEQNNALFHKLVWTYVFVASGLLLFLITRPYRFNLQLTVQVAIDVIILTLIMFSNGGQKSGIAVLVLVVVAGSGLVGQGRLTLFYAALASVATLLEQGWRILTADADPGDFVRTGIICIGFFGTAIVARLLSQRVIANETLARERGLELDEQRRVSERIVSDMEDGVLVTDNSGRVHLLNPKAQALLGSNGGEQPTLGSISGELAERFAQWHRQRLEVEDSLRHPSGRLLRLRYLPPREGSNKALIYIEDMERVQHQAQQFKLAALGRLTANLAHEIRNPLAAISHAAELLAEENPDPLHHRLARIIHDNTLRLNRLVTEVLELGRRDQAHRERLRWRTFVGEFIDELTLHDPSTVARVTVSRSDFEIHFDRGHLYQILWNLLNNGLRHASQSSGSVQVKAGQNTETGLIEIDIVDDGPGIQANHRQQIFEPFFTTHGAGTGLGLYIARELCEANGAQISLIESATGAHFRITVKGE